MATAEELLSGSMSRDRTCVIDSDLRTIIIPRTITNLGVESDDDVMRLPFRMPADYCGTSLMKFAIRINYLNANAEPDVYEVTNMTDNGDGTISFYWLVGRHAALYKGDVKFNVCMRLVDGTGSSAKVLKEFNTAVATLPILEGLETAADAIISIPEYNDIFEQWKTELFGIENSAVANIHAKAQDALAAVRRESNTKADAIVQTAQGGRVVSLYDSSDDPLRGLRVFGNTLQETTTGKNLLDVPYAFSWKGAYERSISIPPGTYVLSYRSVTQQNGRPVNVRFVENSKFISLSPGPATDVTVTFDVPETYVYIYSSGYTSEESANVEASIEHLMVSLYGGEYELFTGGRPAPNPLSPMPLHNSRHSGVSALGKNLIDVSKSSCYKNGVVSTPHSTGNTLGGMLAEVGVAPGETYTFSYTCDGGDRIIVRFVDVDDRCFGPFDLGWGQYLSAYGGTYGPVGDSGVTITVPNDPEIKEMHIYLCNMHDCGEGNYNIYSNIQLEHGFTATEYEQFYQPSTSVKSAAQDEFRDSAYAGHLFGFPVTEGGNYTDASGQQWVCDEVDFERGVLVLRFETRTFNGTESWVHYPSPSNGINQFYTSVEDCHIDSNQVNAMSTHLRGIRMADRQNNMNTVYTASQSGSHYVCMNLPDIADIDEFRAFLQNAPITVMYRLKEPVEHPILDLEVEGFKRLASRRPKTTVFDRGYPKPFLEVSYNVDTNLYIEKLRATITELHNEVEDLKKNGMPSVARISYVELPASGWQGDVSPYRQEVTVPGATENSQVDLTPSVDQLTVFHNKDLAFVAENDGGTITVYAVGQKPENDYTIQVTITEVVR